MPVIRELAYWLRLLIPDDLLKQPDGALFRILRQRWWLRDLKVDEAGALDRGQEKRLQSHSTELRVHLRPGDRAYCTWVPRLASCRPLLCVAVWGPEISRIADYPLSAGATVAHQTDHVLAHIRTSATVNDIGRRRSLCTRSNDAINAK